MSFVVCRSYVNRGSLVSLREPNMAVFMGKVVIIRPQLWKKESAHFVDCIRTIYNYIYPPKYIPSISYSQMLILCLYSSLFYPIVKWRETAFFTVRVLGRGIAQKMRTRMRTEPSTTRWRLKCFFDIPSLFLKIFEVYTTRHVRINECPSCLTFILSWWFCSVFRTVQKTPRYTAAAGASYHSDHLARSALHSDGSRSHWTNRTNRWGTRIGCHRCHPTKRMKTWKPLLQKWWIKKILVHPEVSDG